MEMSFFANTYLIVIKGRIQYNITIFLSKPCDFARIELCQTFDDKSMLTFLWQFLLIGLVMGLYLSKMLRPCLQTGF